MNDIQSETTLVANAEEAHRFYLTSDNPSTTKIITPVGQVLYTVVTTFNNGTVTTVRHGDDFVASLQWNATLSDKVKIGEGGSAVSLRKALNIPLLFARTASFTDTDGNKFEWRGHAPGQVLKLYALTGSRGAELVASFYGSRVDQETGSRSKAYLDILPKAQKVLDTVIWSFLFLEKNRRLADNNATNSTNLGYGAGSMGG